MEMTKVWKITAIVLAVAFAISLLCVIFNEPKSSGRHYTYVLDETNGTLEVIKYDKIVEIDPETGESTSSINKEQSEIDATTNTLILQGYYFKKSGTASSYKYNQDEFMNVIIYGLKSEVRIYDYMPRTKGVITFRGDYAFERRPIVNSVKRVVFASMTDRVNINNVYVNDLDTCKTNYFGKVKDTAEIIGDVTKFKNNNKYFYSYVDGVLYKFVWKSGNMLADIDTIFKGILSQYEAEKQGQVYNFNVSLGNYLDVYKCKSTVTDLQFATEYSHENLELTKLENYRVICPVKLYNVCSDKKADSIVYDGKLNENF